MAGIDKIMRHLHDIELERLNVAIIISDGGEILFHKLDSGNHFTPMEAS